MRTVAATTLLLVACAPHARPPSSPPPAPPPPTPPHAAVAAPPVAAPPPIDLPGERADAPVPISLPEVPPLTLPIPASSYQALAALQVRPRAYLDTDVRVEGYIVSIYDCVAATMARTHATRADAERSIARDPTQCARPNFHLATTPDEPPDTGTWVVDVPRLPTAAERAYLPREELAAWPPVPTLTVGARVVVTGHFSTTSPAGAASDGGLIVYSGLEQRLATQPPTIQPGPPPTLAPPPVIVDPGTPIAPALAEACRAALARRDVLAMAAPCAQASDAAPRDAAFAHLAAGAAFQRAFAPGAAVDAELATAQRYLARAVANDPRLWRAHLYLGKIAYRAGDHFAAAHAFTAALRADPSQGEPALLLARLYRAWRRWPEALAVYQAASETIGTPDAAMFVFEAAHLLTELDRPTDAEELLTRLLDKRPDYLDARVLRGRLRLDRGALQLAVKDLDRAVALATTPQDQRIARALADRAHADLTAAGLAPRK